MSKRILIFIMLLPLVLAGCQGEAEPTAEDTAVPTVAPVLPTATLEPVPSETIPPLSAGHQGPEPPALQGLTSDCTLVSSMPDPPEELATLFAETEDDWVSGLDTATVTIVEYGDFQ